MYVRMHINLCIDYAYAYLFIIKHECIDYKKHNTYTTYREGTTHIHIHTLPLTSIKLFIIINIKILKT